MPSTPGKNIVLLSIDEVRRDNYSCYGYEKMQTENVDQLAHKGVMFDTCIGPACLTAVCMSSVISASYPDKHTVRGPFSHLQAKTVAEVLKEHDYTTGGFVGNGLLGARHGFAHGFDYYDEPREDTSWGSWNAEKKEVFYEGNWWLDRMFAWLKKNHSSKFFIWGHYFETHEGAEQALLKKGALQEGVLSEFSYKDAKIKYMDEQLIGTVIKLFDELNLWEDTILAVMSDHGTNLGEHPARPVPHRPYKMVYPQHTTLYDVDIRVPLIMRGAGLPEGKKVKGMVRSIDVVPTLLDLAGVPADDFDCDGASFTSAIASGRAEGIEAYAEMLYPLAEGIGALQALRTDEFKFIRDLIKGTEEFYNLVDDPLEQNNLIEDARKSKKDSLEGIRKTLNSHLFELEGRGATFQGEDREEVKDRLRKLGYME